MNIRIFFLLFFLSSFSFLGASAEDYGFFSPERFILKTEVVANLSGDGQTQKSIRKFSEAFNKGADELEKGELTLAESDLHLARTLWPEFFGPDFLLALLYERTGDIDVAARYYKSYLVKLKALEEGRYGISAHLIRGMLGGRSETYGEAFDLVRERLLAKGIAIEKVRPVFVMPALLYPAAVVLMFFILYFASCNWFLPRWRRYYKITHPPENFWVCTVCLTANPVPNKVCQECGLAKDKK
jgi:hypothetical protein